MDLRCPFKECVGKDSYAEVANLNKHLRSKHSDSRRCPIPDCAEVFAEAHQLLQHIRAHLIPGYVTKTVHQYDQPTYQALNGNRNREVKGESRILKMFKGVFNLMGKKDTLDYGDFVVVMHPSYKIPLATFECVRFQDLHGQNEICLKGTVNFVQDPHYDKNKQAVQTDYKNSGYEKGHLVSLHNYSRNRQTFYSTFSFTNCAPMKADLNNGPIKMAEDLIRSLVEDNGRALVITLSGIPESKKDVKFMESTGRTKNEKKMTTVAITTYFGKIVVYRNLVGLHVKAWRFLQTDKFKGPPPADQTKEEKLTPFYDDPLKLAKEAGFPLELEKTAFASINGAAQKALDSPVLPIWKEFFDFLNSTGEAAEEPESGPSKPKKTKIETVTSENE